MTGAFRRTQTPAQPQVAGLVELVAETVGVYRARQETTGAPVQLRVHAAPVDDTTADEFRAEVTAVGALGSPHVAIVYECGILSDGRPYRVGEPFAGTLLGQTGLDPAAVGRQLALGLAALHGAGLVHGQPSPIAVGRRADGSLAWLDPGAALREDAGSSVLHSPQQLYDAPETMRDGTRTASCDLYGLGATLYTLVAGQAPFVARMGETPGEHVLRILHDPVPPLPADAASPELRTLIVDLLAKDPDDRPRDAASVAEQLAALIDPAADEPAPVTEPAHGSAVPPTEAVYEPTEALGPPTEPAGPPTPAVAQEPTVEAEPGIDTAAAVALDQPEPAPPTAAQPDSAPSAEQPEAEPEPQPVPIDEAATVRPEPEPEPEPQPQPVGESEPPPAAQSGRHAARDQAAPGPAVPAAGLRAAARSTHADSDTATDTGTAPVTAPGPALLFPAPRLTSWPGRSAPRPAAIRDEPQVVESRVTPLPTLGLDSLLSAPARSPATTPSAPPTGREAMADGTSEGPASSAARADDVSTEHPDDVSTEQVDAESAAGADATLPVAQHGDAAADQASPAADDAAAPGRSRPRHLRLVVAAVAATLALVAVLVPWLSGGSGGGSDRKAANPRPSSTASTVVPAYAVALDGLTDKGTYVQLHWSGAPNSRYVIISARAGEQNTTKYVGTATSYKMPTVAGVPYCFQVQATDGISNAESKSMGIRNAQCTNG